MKDKLKYFKGSNGKSYTVPVADVDGFMQMAQGEGVSVEEVAAPQPTGREQPTDDHAEEVRQLTFKGSNGKKYTVPEGEVDGFRQMAQQEGVTLTETDADGNELPTQVKFRGSDGKTYDVPREEVGGFLEMAKQNGVEVSEMKDLGIGGTLKAMKEAELVGN